MRSQNKNKPSGECTSSSPESLVIIVSGPSGVGKDTILNRMKILGCPFEFITTVTTRPRRAVEKEGVDYHFISVDEFQALKDSNGLLEYASVYGNWYGVPKSAVKQALDRGRDIIIKVDIQGAANIKKILPEAVFIFIMPPSPEELENRLTRRRTETTSDLSLRLETAEAEIKQKINFDYVVINPCDDIDSALRDFKAIVKAEKCRVHPRRVKLD